MRRSAVFLAAGLATALTAGTLRCREPGGTPAASPGDTTGAGLMLDDLEHRTFNFFWETTPASTGLTPDRWPTKSFSSIAAVGFALGAYGIGIERGWITRAQSVQRVLNTLRFFW